MNKRNELLKNIYDFADKLKTICVWHNSKRPFGHISYSEGKTDYLYEFFCYLKIVADLINKNQIAFDPGEKMFARKPGKKKDSPRFLIINPVNGKTSYQICAGTKIKKNKGKKNSFAPDISFQIGDSSDEPTYKDVIIIMDAKYSTDNDSKISNDEIYLFAKHIEDFELEKKNILPINFSLLKDLSCNCLITNAKANEDSIDYCTLSNLKQVEKFDLSGSYRVIG